ncbi:hypothetical protein BD310DRAFT_367301 [Dichomitus squalens]|uniref:Uncharacterized protein n=1 Tax=Dichomitus squalens TaxID=114155 RepID=A0A4Q9PDH0_9APHY|nr:hypothetical protein BD310DRAFT_367301 [Dichomitus squalens]
MLLRIQPLLGAITACGLNELASCNIVLDAGENLSLPLRLVRRQASHYGPHHIDVAIQMGAVPVPPRRSTHRSPSLPSMAVLPRSTFDGRVNRIWSDPLEHSDYGLMRLHQSISLTLLGVDRKALNLQDYSIRLDAPNPNNLDMHSLTMSTSSSLFTSSVCRQAKRRGASVYCWPLASTWSHRVRRRLAHMRERTRTVCCGMARPPSGERQALGLDTRRANVALTTPSGVPLTLCLN